MFGRVSKECAFVTIQKDSCNSDSFLTRNEAQEAFDTIYNTSLHRLYVANDVEYKALEAQDYFVYMIVAIALEAALLVILVGTITYIKCKK